MGGGARLEPIRRCRRIPAAKPAASDSLYRMGCPSADVSMSDPAKSAWSEMPEKEKCSNESSHMAAKEANPPAGAALGATSLSRKARSH